MTFVGERYGQAVWSNFPVSDVPRPGLALGDLSTAQRDAAMNLLRVLLSPEGYQKIADIMGSDQALADGGTPFHAGAAYYTIGIFGTPSAATPWMLQFGGHHLALNVTIAGECGVLAPALTGAQPALYTSNGKTVRVLARENDKAFALLDALDEAQRRQAILSYRVADLVLGPGHDGETIQPEGLRASAMDGRQRAMLLDLISEWAGIVNVAYARSRMAEIEADLGDTYFAWSGPTTHEPGRNGAAYYRIQGPRLVIEFARALDREPSSGGPEPQRLRAPGGRPADLPQGGRQGKANVTSLVERTSRFTFLLANEDKRSAAVVAGMGLRPFWAARMSGIACCHKAVLVLTRDSGAGFGADDPTSRYERAEPMGPRRGCRSRRSPATAHTTCRGL